MLSKIPPTPRSTLARDQINTAIFRSLSFCWYTEDFTGLPENLITTENIIKEIKKGVARLRMISSITNAEAPTFERRYNQKRVT